MLERLVLLNKIYVQNQTLIDPGTKLWVAVVS